MGDRTKLPKWAQNELDRLEKNIEYWKRQAGVGDDPTNTFIDRMDNRTPLPDGARLAFVLDSGFAVNVWTDGDAVYVNAHGTVAVVPSASNSIRIRQGRY